MDKDIFISYKNDGSGNQFANRLVDDLEKVGYSVYFNSHEERAACFPERLKAAVAACKDFVLILSEGCLAQLMRHDDVDWVREELLTAHALDKHIIPILLENVELPKNNNDMPPDLRFLPHIDALRFPEQYIKSPFNSLTETLYSKQDGQYAFRNAYNENPLYDVTKHYTETLELARNGNVKAMYEVGVINFYGSASERESENGWNYEEAAFWLKKVSESDHELRFHADNMLARMYYQGLVPDEPQSYEVAFEYHSRAAEHSVASASGQAFMMRIGAGCEFDFEKILEYYKSVIRRGDDIAVMALAQFLTSYGKYNEALELFHSMESLSPDTEYQIGLLYKTGAIFDPPKPDYIQAAYYLRNAADSNHMQAAYEYALMCFRPTGRFKKNFLDAQKYFTIAADGGVAAAQYILGCMYKNGHVTKDLEKAVFYLEKARNQGHSLSALELASIYQQPEFRNYEQAYLCASMAASHGVGEGEFMLGNLLFWGRGCRADMNKAYEMYTRAYDHGIYNALLMREKITKIRNENHQVT